jgi:hypothetical protein
MQARCVATVRKELTMLKHIRVTALLALAAVLTTGALAQKGRVESDVAKANATRAVQEIAWFSSLPTAQKAAAKDGKLVLWMHMLGNIFADT